MRVVGVVVQVRVEVVEEEGRRSSSIATVPLSFSWASGPSELMLEVGGATAAVVVVEEGEESSTVVERVLARVGGAGGPVMVVSAAGLSMEARVTPAVSLKHLEHM